ncbi:GATA transcription factor 7 [Mucuna pruriens]|uniref:GATA transcription factor 7 n=1 Tax=Mucuna pruriens TaxID=157652 RepID=A0A371IIC7_MUCPR|nr:GATA transcription factor 7 [Mucuna pruriens]
MEVAVAKALKTSLRREFIVQQTSWEENLCLNPNTVAGGEDFSVDDLFDFSDGSLHYEQQEYDEEKETLSVSSQSQDRGGEDDSNSNSTGGSYDSLFTAELAVPAGDLEDLEWVSHFVDDSLPELSLLYPVRSEEANRWVEPEPSAKKTPRFPCKARSVRSRKPNARVWSLGPLLSLPSSPSSCSSSATEPPAKKQKKRAEAQAVGAQIQRRCSHCQVQKTPQWRTGPLGAKTLCNACGVRYKSGRLYSEYRPACSPTFCSDIHSNSHRKVLEIRKRKEVPGPETGLAQAQMVLGTSQRSVLAFVRERERWVRVWSVIEALELGGMALLVLVGGGGDGLLVDLYHRVVLDLFQHHLCRLAYERFPWGVWMITSYPNL